jgi:hypothetical protein
MRSNDVTTIDAVKSTITSSARAVVKTVGIKTFEHVYLCSKERTNQDDIKTVKDSKTVDDVRTVKNIKTVTKDDFVTLTRTHIVTVHTVSFCTYSSFLWM